MFTQDHLNLRLIRLKPREEWLVKGNGLLFVLPKAGVGNCISGPTTQRFVPSDVLVLDETTGGKLVVADKEELLFYCFSICVEHLFPLFDGKEISLLRSVTDGFKGTKLYPASSPTARECHRLLDDAPPRLTLDHRSHLLRMATTVLSVEFKNAHPPREGYVEADEHLSQVFEKLSMDEILKLSVPSLAGRFGVSRRHLNRLFHRNFGLSVAALRMELRLLKAASLLRDSAAKVIRVAEDCGFNHLGLFNTCFKRRFGSPPGEWRKRNLAGKGRPAALGEADPVCPLRTNGLCPLTGQELRRRPPAPDVRPARKTTARARLAKGQSPQPPVACKGDPGTQAIAAGLSASSPSPISF